MSDNTSEQQDLKDIIASKEEGFGYHFKCKRDEKKLSIEIVSQELRLDKKIIIALENEDYTQLPASAFVCGYIRNYAKFLNIQPEPLIEYYKNDQLDDNLEPKLKVRKEEAGQKSSIFPALLRPFFLSLFVLVLALTTWQYWPEISEKFFNANNIQQEDIIEPYNSDQETDASDALLLPEPKVINDEISTSTAVHSDEADVGNNSSQEVDSTPENATDLDDLSSSQSRLGQSVNSEPSDGAMPETIENATTLLSEADSKMAQSQPQIENSQLETEATPVQSVGNSLQQTAGGSLLQAEGSLLQAEGSSLQAEGSSQAINSSTGTMTNGNNAVPTLETKVNQLLIQFSGDSWVSIKDADNTILATGLMKSGKTLFLDGKLPYKVFLGDARMATVRINGKVFDHSSYINKKNTARFKVE